MSTFRGLPTHVLLVHGLVVLVPLTAVLLILCVLWPAARARLVWPAALLAVVVVALTPITTEAGELLEERIGSTPAIEEHTELGGTMLYFVVPLLVAAALVVLLHLRAGRNRPVGRALVALVAVLVVAAGAAATVQTYRVGDSGARAVWTGVVQ
ncbi:DUF2231 domain-containing protein [Nocardia crassostreae]|uniref:DUF2231 domain-containing protein n=1 Tax=Nocardia crassostreae TaxID=53428 RepID=UPI0008349E91|nr:DUF2231 domain-containing protein [Nocardia crassostreae]